MAPECRPPEPGIASERYNRINRMVFRNKRVQHTLTNLKHLKETSFDAINRTKNAR